MSVISVSLPLRNGSREVWAQSRVPFAERDSDAVRRLEAHDFLGRSAQALPVDGDTAHLRDWRVRDEALAENVAGGGAVDQRVPSRTTSCSCDIVSLGRSESESSTVSTGK